MRCSSAKNSSSVVAGKAMPRKSERSILWRNSARSGRVVNESGDIRIAAQKKSQRPRGGVSGVVDADARRDGNVIVAHVDVAAGEPQLVAVERLAVERAIHVERL